MLTHFFATIKEELHPNTDAKHGQVSLDSIQQRLLKSLAAQIIHAVAKCALTRQDDSTPACQVGWCIDNIHWNMQGLRHRFKGFVDAAQVTNAIVNNGNH